MKFVTKLFFHFVPISKDTLFRAANCCTVQNFFFNVWFFKGFLFPSQCFARVSVHMLDAH